MTSDKYKPYNHFAAYAAPLQRLLQATSYADPPTFVIAFSGGLDSRVLLDVVVHVFKGYPEHELCVHHINHQLHPQSNVWAEHCKAICQTYGLPYQQTDLICKPKKGESIEALARTMRYHALFDKGNKIVLTAHHVQDQAESFLLQALRGAGPKGLSAMSVRVSMQKGELWRPFLSLRKEALLQYAKHFNLDWIEDPSNQNIHYSRNYLRHRVFPILAAQRTGNIENLSRSAKACAETMDALNEYLEKDYQTLIHSSLNTLSLSGLLTKSVTQRACLIRYWLARQGYPMPSYKKLQHVLQDVLLARQDAKPCVTYGGVVITRFLDALYVLREQDYFARGVNCTWDLPLNTPCTLTALNLRLCFMSAQGEGFSLKKIQQASSSIKICFGGGAEKIQIQHETFHRTLKHCWQRFQIPPWRRRQIPLLYIGDKLAAIVGYAISETFAARPDESSCIIQIESI